MITDVVEFLSDIQSINPTKSTGFVLFFNNEKYARSVQAQLSQDFNIPSVLDTDNDGTNYVVPLKSLDNKTTFKFISHRWEWHRDQEFVQYLITLYNSDAANKIYNIMLAHGYNVILSPNNSQLTVKCLTESARNTEMQELKSKLETFEKTFPKSIANYFNKVLFNGVIENPEYRKVCAQEFSPETIKQNRDLIIREILYRYFNIIIYAHLTCAKFDANKLDRKTIQSINLIRDFLYSVASQYIDTQIDTAKKTTQQPTIRFDYLKNCAEFDNFKKVLKHAKEWQRTNTRKHRFERRNDRMSQRWAYKIMDLNDGYSAFRLGGQEALDYENRMLKHPTTIYYYDDIYEGFTRYSIRKGYKPILTMEVHNDKIVECYGYNNNVPCDNELREAVRTFMHEYKLTISGNNKWNKLIAYIKQDGVLYDVFNLPPKFTVRETLNLEGMCLNQLPYMPTVTIDGNLLCGKNNLLNPYGAPDTVLGDCDFSRNPLTSLYGMPRNISGRILLPPKQLTEETLVPFYLRHKLNDILGIGPEVIKAWRKQIAEREAGVQDILSLLRAKNK